MASPSYTYTLANSTTADADEVMQNFNDILNGVSDGTKDASVAALTVAGNANFNGNTTLGNATGDTITVTGRIASDVNPSANATYDLGSAALSYASLFLDNGATDGGAVYFDAGTDQYLKANAAGTEIEIGGFTTLETKGAQVKTLALYAEAKSADYTVTDTDGVSVILMTTSTTDRTVTLPTASANTGRVLEIIKVDSATGVCTVDGEGSETIAGYASFPMAKQFDNMKIISDGSNWQAMELNVSTTMSTAGTFNAGGAFTGAVMILTRSGRTVTLEWSSSTGTPSGTSTRIDITAAVPVGFRPPSGGARCPIVVVDAGTEQQGLGSLIISTAGVIDIYHHPDTVSASWPASSGSGTRTGSLSWSAL